MAEVGASKIKLGVGRFLEVSGFWRLWAAGCGGEWGMHITHLT